MFYTKLIQ